MTACERVSKLPERGQAHVDTRQLDSYWLCEIYFDSYWRPFRHPERQLSSDWTGSRLFSRGLMVYTRGKLAEEGYRGWIIFIVLSNTLSNNHRNIPNCNTSFLKLFTRIYTMCSHGCAPPFRPYRLIQSKQPFTSHSVKKFWPMRSFGCLFSRAERGC